MLLIDALRRHGVAVVVSAGNDSSTRPCYPAAFAPWLTSWDPPTPQTPGDPAAPPVVAVGALNPDGSTALMSNDGPWVTCQRPGAAVVSTMPTDQDGSLTPSVDLPGLRARERRRTIDPDGFAGGFGVWSGTSFSAPLMAGDLAEALLVRREHTGPDPVDWAGASAARRAAAWAVISELTGLPAPS